ncbi:MAG TPA: c-type cytochrome [Rhizomicrobium sp.]|jgi:cytochrome c553|nr:c-type cytochrome [Rhizomicrobium sp.]
MTRLLKWGGLGAAILAGIACALLAFAWLDSESVIERHYPLLSMDVPVSDKPDVIARGHHLAKLTACLGCHGERLQGQAMPVIGHFHIIASNLTNSPLTDEELARAIRDGLKPDGKSLWIMPSEDYTYMSVADVAAIVSYVRSLPAAGHPTPPPRFKRRDRIAILEGDLEPTAMRVADGGASLDLGPRYEGGRYIARTTCAACHGLDLTGTPDRRVPDLAVVGRYTLRDFFALMREGHAPDYHPTPAMKALAHSRYSSFKDYEVMALYDYLNARASAFPPR